MGFRHFALLYRFLDDHLLDVMISIMFMMSMIYLFDTNYLKSN